jgi:hypothetical protein
MHVACVRSRFAITIARFSVRYTARRDNGIGKSQARKKGKGPQVAALSIDNVERLTGSSQAGEDSRHSS